MSENLRELVNRIVEIESGISALRFLSTEHSNNKSYSEEYQKKSSELNELYAKIDEIEKDYEILKLLSNTD